MKKIITLFIVFITLFGIMGCAKQKNCENGLTGKIVYYKKPQTDTFCGVASKYHAIFIPDDTHLATLRIYSDLPKKFQAIDTIHVRVSFNIDPYSGGHLYIDCIDCRIYKLRCIEMAD